MKNKIIIIASWLLVLLTMAMIYSFSDETSEESTKTSGAVVEQILGIFMDKEDITPPVVKKYQFPIRKAAHFGIYMLLGFCMINAFDKSFKIKAYLNIVFSVISSCLYAVTDEIHQGYIVGRGPQVRDVLIDSSGAIVGVFIFVGLYFLYKKLILSKVDKIRKIKENN